MKLVPPRGSLLHILQCSIVCSYFSSNLTSDLYLGRTRLPVLDRRLRHRDFNHTKLNKMIFSGPTKLQYQTLYVARRPRQNPWELATYMTFAVNLVGITLYMVISFRTNDYSRLQMIFKPQARAFWSWGVDEIGSWTKCPRQMELPKRVGTCQCQCLSDNIVWNVFFVKRRH